MEWKDILSEDRWGKEWGRNRWWTLPPGIEFITAKGDHFSLPFVPGDVENSLKMEFYIDGSLFQTTLLCVKDNNSFPAFKIKGSYYYYFTHNMPACKGSSGGPIIINQKIYCPTMSTMIATHFGSFGQGSMSGLVAIFLHDKISFVVMNVLSHLRNAFRTFKQACARKYFLDGNGYESVLKRTFPAVRMERFWRHSCWLDQIHFDTREEAEKESKKTMVEFFLGYIPFKIEQQLENFEFPDDLVHELGLWSYISPAKDSITKLWKTQLVKLFSILLVENMKQVLSPPSLPPDGDGAETNSNLQNSFGDLLVAEMEKDCTFVIPLSVKDRMVDILFDDSVALKNGTLVQSTEVSSGIDVKKRTMMDRLALIMALSEMHKDSPSPALLESIRDMSEVLFDDFFIPSDESLPEKSK